MKIRLLFTMLIMAIAAEFNAFADEIITAEAAGDSVIIRDEQIFANCCSVFISEFTNLDYVITIIQTDTSVEKCKCMCHFDITQKILNLRNGFYKAEIYRQEFKKYSYPSDTTYLVGTTDFTIGVGLAMPPYIFTFSQSECYTPTTVDESNKSNDLKVYPNPSAGTASVELYAAEESLASIVIVDLFGRDMQYDNNITLSSGKNVIPINITNLPDGIYFCKIIMPDGTVNAKKLIKI